MSAVSQRELVNAAGIYCSKQKGMVSVHASQAIARCSEKNIHKTPMWVVHRPEKTDNYYIYTTNSGRKHHAASQKAPAARFNFSFKAKDSVSSMAQDLT